MMEQIHFPSLLYASSSMIFLFSQFHFITNNFIEGNIVSQPRNATIPAIYAFGDSFAEQGNNNYIKTIARANFLPYGKDFMGGNHPTGRVTNGKTLPDLIAEELGIKELVPPYLDPKLQDVDLLTGVSFGSASSGFDPETSMALSVLSSSDQLRLFKEYTFKLKGIVGENGLNKILSNGVYLIIAGTGDLANTYFTVRQRQLQFDIGSYTDYLVRLASEFVQKLHALGARRILVFGVPPIGCLPSQRTIITRICPENENQAARMYNSKLNVALNSINHSFRDPKARVVYVDFYNPLFDLIQDQGKNGFIVVDRGCCGTGTIEASILCNPLVKTCEDDLSYLFWDTYHPTERGLRILVNEVLQNSINKLF